jgi:hypothetical protein
MQRNWIARLLPVALSILLSSAMCMETLPALAHASGGSGSDMLAIVSSNAAHSAVILTARPGLAVKVSSPPASSLKPHGCGWPSCNPATLSGSYSEDITPPGGSNGPISVSFSSSDPYANPYGLCGLAEACTVTSNGSSKAAWLGCCPFNATSVADDNTWTVSGLVFSIQVPGGPGWSTSGNSATWNTSVNNNWIITDNFSNLTFNGLDLYWISESTNGIFQFGSTFWNIQTSDGAAL